MRLVEGNTSSSHTDAVGDDGEIPLLCFSKVASYEAS
jgi:hypothetical protein